MRGAKKNFEKKSDFDADSTSPLSPTTRPAYVVARGWRSMRSRFMVPGGGVVLSMQCASAASERVFSMVNDM